MTDSQWDIGDVIAIGANFVDANDAAANPTTVICYVLDPDGTESTPTVTHPAVGQYTANFTATKFGRWRFRFESDPAFGAVVEGYRDVRVSPFS